jgi:hypothetical protein
VLVRASGSHVQCICTVPDRTVPLEVSFCLLFLSMPGAVLAGKRERERGEREGFYQSMVEDGPNWSPVLVARGVGEKVLGQRASANEEPSTVRKRRRVCVRDTKRQYESKITFVPVPVTVRVHTKHTAVCLFQ